MTFLFADTTPVHGSNGPEYRFEEIPPEKFVFKEGQTVGTVAHRHFAFMMVAKRQGKHYLSIQCIMASVLSFLFHAGVNVYSLLLYTSMSPSLEQNMAVFCVTPCHPLYQKVCDHKTFKYTQFIRVVSIFFLAECLGCFEGAVPQHKSLVICDGACAPLWQCGVTGYSF